MSLKPASGLIVVDKPSGITSHDCVHYLRQILHEDKIGHAGTLDPLASGVLLVLVGRATLDQNRFLTMDKTYHVWSELGIRSLTGDRGGAILPSPPFEGITDSRLSEMLVAFRGPQWQVPHRIAAVKFKGKALYAWTRAGFEIKREAKRILVSAFELIGLNGSFWEARVSCSKGTYIRTLVEDVAQQLGTFGVVDRLVRERVGPYKLADALTLDAIRMKSEQSQWDFFHE